MQRLCCLGCHRLLEDRTHDFCPKCSKLIAIELGQVSSPKPIGIPFEAMQAKLQEFKNKKK